MTGEIIPINDEVRKALQNTQDHGLEISSEEQSLDESLEKISKYETVALEGMSALVHYFNSSDPTIRAVACAAIDRVVETIHSQPAESMPK